MGAILQMWRFQIQFLAWKLLYFDSYFTAICSRRSNKTSYIKRTSVGTKIVDHSDVVGAFPVGAALTASSFLT